MKSLKNLHTYDNVSMQTLQAISTPNKRHMQLRSKVNFSGTPFFTDGEVGGQTKQTIHIRPGRAIRLYLRVPTPHQESNINYAFLGITTPA